MRRIRNDCLVTMPSFKEKNWIPVTFGKQQRSLIFTSAVCEYNVGKYVWKPSIRAKLVADCFLARGGEERRFHAS